MKGIVSSCTLLFTVNATLSLGLVTDGEFNSLRTQEETRPLHIWQLLHDARESVSKISRGNLLKMLLQIGGRYFNLQFYA